jgi:diguanylate cyclase (GGDEF)-like protein/PAS domain S-box-containing protein
MKLPGFLSAYGLAFWVAAAASLATLGISYLQWAVPQSDGSSTSTGMVLAIALLAFGFIAARAFKTRAAFIEEIEVRKGQLDTAIEHMAQGLVMYDSECRVAVVNRRYLEMYGLSAQAVTIGMSLREVLQRRKDAGSFFGDIEVYCQNVQKSLAGDVHEPVLTEPNPGRFINVANTPIGGGGWVSTHEDVTERQKLLEGLASAEKQAQAQKVRTDTALNNMTHGLCMYDAEGRVVLFNKQYAVLRGHDPDTLLGRSLLDLLRKRHGKGDLRASSPEKFFAEMQAAAARGETTTKIVKTGDRLLRVVDQPMPCGGWVATFVDITEQTQLEAERDRNRDFLNMIIDHVPSAIFVKNVRDRQYVLVNRAGRKFWGMPPEAMIGKTAAEVFPPREALNIENRENILVASGEPIFDEREITTPTDGVRTIHARRLVLRDPAGEAAYVLGVVDDITDRRAADARIAHLAHYDALTGLPNRTLFHDQLHKRLTALGPAEGLAVLYLDLDHFKSVNDTLGHAIGDELLRGVAARLKSCLRDGDLFARLSGDEFAIGMSAGPSIQDLDERDPHERAQQLRKAVVEQPFDLGGHQAVVDLSIGLALAPEHGSTVGELLKHADLALYGAKLDGRATCRYFEPEMNARMRLRRDLEMDLRTAIAEDQLQVHYQPVVRLQDGQVTGCEALVRWLHPVRGMIPPSDFIPVAEDTGLIGDLGEWVLRRACSDAARWPDDKKVAVNVSPIQLRNSNFSELVLKCLGQSGLPAHRLELEMTESVLMQSTDATLATLRRMQEAGIGISLDDFGTGYSSLSYLRRFPFNRIKIDRSFVTDIAARPDALAIVRTILMLAESLGMTTTAEGVEKDDQKVLLKAIGCHEMQGFLFSRPLTSNDTMRLLREDGEADRNVA